MAKVHKTEAKNAEYEGKKCRKGRPKTQKIEGENATMTYKTHTDQ